MCRRIIKTFSSICRFQHKFRAASSLFTAANGGGEESSGMESDYIYNSSKIKYDSAHSLYTNLKIVVLMADEYYRTEIPLALYHF